MQRLILLRHGKAESVSDLGGDAERGLTDRGRRDSALMGRVLSQAGVKPDLVLVSDARRTRETWEEVSAAFPSAEAEFDPGLYLASAEHP
jgi:phosphohistidine phosphatase